MEQYPSTKITELHAYMTNFNSDINEMKDILTKINDWTNRGIDINLAITPLNTQIQNWENTMNELLGLFRQNVITLKQLDDRIQNTTNIDILDNGTTYTEKWEYLYSKYQSIFTNLESDIVILGDAKNSISGYQTLGVELGDAITEIENQINSIISGISTSLQDLQIIIDRIKEESRKILAEDEIVSNTNSNTNYLAVYSTVSCDANSFILFFNNNTQINWDPNVDGTNILPYMLRAKLDSNSPIYDASIGASDFNTNSTTLYNYVYYGFSKDNMIGFSIDNTTYGSKYEDRHGYQYNINVFYGSLLDGSTTRILDKLTTSFAEMGMTYNHGAVTPEKIYVLYSVDQINDFSNITFRGE